MSDSPICPCQQTTGPLTITNLPGLAAVRYRVGDYARFRAALLESLPGETELINWKPTAQGDLALQMIEWWAYIADVLTFYNERAANEAYLRTAVLPESVKRIIRLLGYRPRPGIGATATLAALLSGSKPVAIPKGYPVQSKPGPGKEPQIFETDADATATAPDSTAAEPTPATTITNRLLLKGKVTAVRAGDVVLLRNKTNAAQFAMSTVFSVAFETGSGGKVNTRVTLTTTPSLPAGSKLTDFRFQRATQSMALWPYPADADLVIQTLYPIIFESSRLGFSFGGGFGIIRPEGTRIQLASVARDIKVGEPLVLNTGSSFLLVVVSDYSEVVWFANPDSPSAPATSPDPKTKVPVPITHSQVTFGFVSATRIDDVRFAFQDAGEIIAEPVSTVSTSLTATAGAFRAGMLGQKVMLEDTAGKGELALATTGDPATTLSLASPPASALAPPLKVLYNLLGVSRGKTVPAETLGTGDATIAGQQFTLAKSPLTYLPATDAGSAETYRSTLTIMVGDVQWKEVPSFFGQPKEARIFVTREDENNKTTVLFGDGINGSRLPTGAAVVATYRYGSGAEAPAAGELSVVVKPLPGLKGFRNPIAAGGGSDPDSADRIRQLAPRTVLTFGRAVSADDYTVLAAQTPGVARARAYWSYDAVRQRTLVTLYVGDDDAAVSAATLALSRSADPNRPVVVLKAVPVPIALTLTVQRHATYSEASVRDGVTAALLDPDTGLFGVNAVQIGKMLFRSQIYEAALRVPGSAAVHSLEFTRLDASGGIRESGFRHFPGEGGFYQLDASDLTLTMEVLDDAG